MAYNLRTSQGIKNIVNESIDSDPTVQQSIIDLVQSQIPGGGQVNTVDLDTTSIGQTLKSSQSTPANIKLKGLVAGVGMSIAGMGTGDILITNTGGGGGGVLTVDDDTTATGQTLKSTTSTVTDVKLKTLKAGTNVTLTPSGTGDLTISSATGGLVNTVSSTGTSTGISLKDTVASTASDIKLNTIKAGTNITLTNNALGDITIDATGGAGSSTLTGLTDVNSTLDNLLMARTTAYAGTGDNNVAVSATNPMPNLSTGNANVILGNNCLDSIITGGSNVAIGNNVNTLATSSNLIGIGNSITVPDLSIIIGNSISNTSTAASSLLVGNNMVVPVSSSGVTCVGHASFTPASGCVYGYACNVTGTDGHGYGKQITLSGNDSCAFGNASSVTFANSVAYGNNSVCSGISSSAIGKTSTAFTNCVAVGTSSSASALDSVAIGAGSSASQTQCVSVGRASSCNTTNGVAIGYNASCQAANCISLGSAVSNIVANSLKTITSLSPIAPASSNGGVLVYNTGGQIGPVSGATTGQVLTYNGSVYQFATPSASSLSAAWTTANTNFDLNTGNSTFGDWASTQNGTSVRVIGSDISLAAGGFSFPAGTYDITVGGQIINTGEAPGANIQINIQDSIDSIFTIVQINVQIQRSNERWTFNFNRTHTYTSPKTSWSIIGSAGGSSGGTLNISNLFMSIRKIA